MADPPPEKLETGGLNYLPETLRLLRGTFTFSDESSEMS
jgi:hypothetical protein